MKEQSSLFSELELGMKAAGVSASKLKEERELL
jgi:hypothetical protein